MDNKKTIDHLNDMLVRNNDAKEGFEKAAEIVENSSFKQYCERQAENRAKFGQKIEAELRTLGAEIEEGTSLKADAHRLWMDIRDALSSGDKAIYDECIRGEESFIEEYQEALNSNQFSAEFQSMIKQQKASAEKALETLKSLKNFAK